MKDSRMKELARIKDEDLIIKSEGLTTEYFRRDDEGNVESIDTALDHVDISIINGRFIGIIGHNGCGKSTLAKNINALITPSEGSLTVCGMDVYDEKSRMEIRARAGMVFQNPDNQIVSSIVEEDCAFGPENLGITSDEIRKRVDRSLSSVGMFEKRRNSPEHLSGGQKQRVAVAGVLSMEPECIIFDESTAMLDPEGREDVLSLAHELNEKKGVTVLWITHYMEELTGADHIFVMDNGKIVMEGAPREIFGKPAELEKHGLTLPGITLLSKLLEENGVPLKGVSLSVDELFKELMAL